jgi:hypothetical protein
MRYKHPWGAKSDALTILFLPSFERSLFNVDLLAHLDDVMSQLAMETLAMGCQPSLCVGMLPPGCFVPLALAPTQARFAVLLDTPLLIVVPWIVGTALPIHLTLEATFFAGIGREFLTERDQIRFPIAWNNRERGWANIQANDIAPRAFVLGLDEGVAL